VRYSIRRTVILGVLVVLVALAGCSRKREEQRDADPIWTPAAVSGSLQLATPGAAILPTAAPPPTAVAAIASPGLTRSAATPAATRDPSLVVVTEKDVVNAVTSGVTAQEGADLQGVRVDFRDGKMHLAADRASYGIVTVDNLQIVGRLVARDGRLQMDTESVSPRGIVTSFVPTIANQALANYTSRWYVEDVQTLEDRLELRIRP
jgi:hypothetical protein